MLTKQELEYKIVSVKRSIEVKSKEVQSDKKYLKSLENQLQELTRGDQRDMFDEEDWDDLGVRETSMEHDLRVNEIDVMCELGG
ncbi:hypothetical protein HWD03_gp069 [Alteromonas phage vB_AmeM_PT11-V22]|uniref:Uncharacterized protein n=1 Tax=Alteromonas phage vB_AmeM_PT11-V22 TaxID=2704031 RepID=A0A6C0R0R8_9CAUD|nr:hypothetical protein HWD03_gp069 [Alteromonas phage vB_AmeM_PT11-V22]QHZ59829.1 hypothetical protein [Alteromonas phage vB_AmeM_PT11-V22]